MAVTGNEDGASHQSLPKSQIEAVLSVPPLKVTEPRQVRHVSVTNSTTIIKGCYQTVLYYHKQKEEDRGGWFLAGWIRESLGRALLEEPILCGRIQRKEDGGDHDDDGDDNNNKVCLEIVSNDSGIRLYEAKFPMRLSEFLGMSQEKDELEAELVFWKEIDVHTPQYSPLFYVQVTKFECGGYSIGISCSILLADIMVVHNFLKKWGEIHNNLLPQLINEDNKAPIFYHPILINEPPLSTLITRTPSQKNGSPNTVLFKITSKEVNFNMELWRELALLCLEEAEQKKLVGSDYFSLLVKESYDVIKIEGCSNSKGSENSETLLLGLKDKIVGANWNDFGDYDVAFHEGNKPVVVSHWIGSVLDNNNGHVIALPCSEENESPLIIVSFPCTEN